MTVIALAWVPIAAACVIAAGLRATLGAGWWSE